MIFLAMTCMTCGMIMGGSASGLNTPPLAINGHSNGTKMSRRRSASEPSLPVNCSSYSRERIRRSDLAYEKGKDKLAHWIGAWGQDEVSMQGHVSI